MVFIANVEIREEATAVQAKKKKQKDEKKKLY